jgi:heme/copper-type cytochrome/quinol oxidase subunit 3
MSTICISCRAFEDVYIAFIITISLSFLFLCFQFIEYMGAPYGIADSVYGLLFIC